MDLRLWSPLLDLDKEWRFEFPKLHETGEFRPSVDVVKTDGALMISAELPGIKAENVEVSLDDDILTIKGEKSEEKEISEEDRYVHERSYGVFSRRIAVPDGVKADDIVADYDNGVLTVRVTLPTEGETEPKRIPVGAKAES